MKKILALILAGVMLLGSSAMVMATEADTGATEGIQSDEEFYSKADLSVLEGKKIGITIQDLKNPYYHLLCTGRTIVELFVEENILIEIDRTNLVRFKTYIDTNI